MRVPTFLPLLFLVALAGLTLGCEEPRTEVRVLTPHPRVCFQDAPPRAEVFVDGRAVGIAGAFNGDPGVLQLESGTHMLELRLGGKSIFQIRIFLGGDELREIRIPALP